MSELCSHFSSILISDLILLISFILSHPLYFSYFIFFSPYLFTLISFLSPLFITTFLLFLAFLAHTHSSISQTHLTSIIKRLQFSKDPTNGEQESDDLGIYEILFGPPSMAAVREEFEFETLIEASDHTPQKDQILEPIPLPGSAEEPPAAAAAENKVSATPAAMEEKRLENFLKILDEFEKLASNADHDKEKGTKKKKQAPSPSPSPSPPPPQNGAKIDKAVEEKKRQSPLINGGSEAENTQNQANSAAKKLESNNSTMSKSRSQSHRFAGGGDDRESLSSYGSMRREREWKRTLACKLFEERHNGGAAAAAAGGEAMDSLWEAHEVESSKNSNKRSERGRRERRREREMNEEDDVVGAQLCCLQALKMSAGKMNLGVGRPNLVKISKAIKGIGWLHSLTKNSKKVHNNGDHRY